MAGPSWLVSRSVKVVPGSLSPSYLIRWGHVDHDNDQNGNHCDENENDSLQQWSDRGLSFVRAVSAQLHSTSLSCLSLSLANHLQYLTRVWYIAALNTRRWKLTFPQKEFCHHNQHEFTIFKFKLNRLFSFHILRIDFFAYKYQRHRGSPSPSKSRRIFVILTLWDFIF